MSYTFTNSDLSWSGPCEEHALALMKQKKQYNATLVMIETAVLKPNMYWSEVLGGYYPEVMHIRKLLLNNGKI